MNYLTLENVTKTYGEKVLFDKIDLQVNKGQKVALVAKNGTGKSTLLRVIAGVEASEGETSKVLIRRDVRIGFLDQDAQFPPGQSVLDAVFDMENPLIEAIKAYETVLLLKKSDEVVQEAIAKMDDLKAWDFEAKIKEILSKLNINRLDQQVDTMSGGQRKRLALAKLLIDEPEFLILDEPTNHLDLDMIEWLETYLQLPNLTLFMVTHDRYFLDRVCNLIVELDRGKLYKYQGNYGDYLEKKANRLENEAVVYEKNKKLFKRELEWVNRMPKARGTKAKSRVDSFKDLKEELANKRLAEDIQIDIKGQRLGKKILELHNIRKAYGDLKIVEQFDYKFKKKERVGIVGPNGVGKSTFLNILTKSERVDGGKVVIGENTVFGYYGQDGISMDGDKRVIDVITDIAEFIPLEKGAKLTAPQLLERFLFPRKQQQVYVSQLSGGEKRRLYLLTVLMENPNFLILDEPTNDLDIMTLNILEDFLMDFPGCVIIVTHDRYFMDKIVDHLFVFQGAGKIKDFNGTYSEYRAYEKEMERISRADTSKPEERKTTPKPVTSEGERKLTYEERKELGRLEKEISKLEEKKSKVSDAFNNPNLTGEEIADLSKELNQINDSLEEKELRWMELAEFG